MNVSQGAALAAALAVSSLGALAQPARITLLNLSYDPTRELYDVPAGQWLGWVPDGLT